MPAVVEHACNPTPKEVEAGGSWDQGEPGLHKESDVRLYCISRLCQRVGKERGRWEEKEVKEEEREGD